MPRGSSRSYSKLSPHHKHFIDPTNCPWVPEDDDDDDGDDDQDDDYDDDDDDDDDDGDEDLSKKHLTKKI